MQLHGRIDFRANHSPVTRLVTRVTRPVESGGLDDENETPEGDDHVFQGRSYSVGPLRNAIAGSELARCFYPAAARRLAVSRPIRFLRSYMNLKQPRHRK